MDKIPLLVIVGPTASGKTTLAVQLAKKYNGEVISADSMQIYKGMDISTAKPTEDEKCGIPHHLIGFVDLTCNYSVADYVKDARECIKDVYSRGHLPIVAGGTGLYISSLVDNIQFDESVSDTVVRKRLSDEMNHLGPEELLKRLSSIDPITAESLHPNNKTRIIRALEVYELTGKTISQQKKLSRQVESPYDTCIIGLNYEDRNDLYDKINNRVDTMVQNGLIEESKDIYSRYLLKTACQAIGYKELIPYFQKQHDLQFCIDKIKQETRRYAKRQLTWFRRNDRINWIMMNKITNNSDIINKCEKIIANCKII